MAAGAGPRRAARHDDRADAGALARQLDGKAGEVERAEVGLNEIGGSLGPSRELAHLDLAMLGEGAHRDEAGLEAAEERDRGLDDRAHLKQGAVAGRQTELEERGPESLGRFVEVGVGETTPLRDERQLRR